MSQQEKDRIMKDFSEGAIEIDSDCRHRSGDQCTKCHGNGDTKTQKDSDWRELHQLRGARRDRGSHRSYCFLITDDNAGLGMQRAKIIESSSDGFYIAEKDLQMRGPGEFFGTKQHGLPELKVADLIRHLPILNSLRDDVKDMIQRDPRSGIPRKTASS